MIEITKESNNEHKILQICAAALSGDSAFGCGRDSRSDASTPGGQSGPTGELSVVGEVSVNGTSAISGATVFSDSTITTARGSSAVVSLGKLGRVEVFPETTVILSFTRSRITVDMRGGGGRVKVKAHVDALVATDYGLIMTTSDKKTDFIVDTDCGNTFVAR